MNEKYVFISQPMRGFTDEQIKTSRAKAIESAFARAKEEWPGCEPVLIDTWITENAPENANAGLWYLGESLKMLAKADLAYFMRGWGDARGCRIENKAAIEYNVPLVVEDYRRD